ncbi:MAG: hypothetical protein SGBAC_001761 [Bacillariaceae sp.]
MMGWAKDCSRIAKEEVGKYHIRSMMEEASRRPRFQPLPSHHATFRSPKIAIGVSVRIPSSDGETYRGCKALSNLKEGELSMSSMAFAIGYNHSIGIMVDEVVKKLHTTASLAKEFFCLSDGTSTSRR